MNLLKSLVVVCVLTCSSHTLAEIAVIAHKSVNETVSQGELKKLFLGKRKALPSGHKIIPIVPKEGNSSSTEFSKRVLSKSRSQLKAYWSQLIFTGKGYPPREFDSDTEIIDIVRDNPNIIGYVDANSIDDSVSVLGKY